MIFYKEELTEKTKKGKNGTRKRIKSEERVSMDRTIGQFVGPLESLSFAFRFPPFSFPFLFRHNFCLLFPCFLLHTPNVWIWKMERMEK